MDNWVPEACSEQGCAHKQHRGPGGPGNARALASGDGHTTQQTDPQISEWYTQHGFELDTSVSPWKRVGSWSYDVGRKRLFILSIHGSKVWTRGWQEAEAIPSPVHLPLPHERLWPNSRVTTSCSWDPPGSPKGAASLILRTDVPMPRSWSKRVCVKCAHGPASRDAPVRFSVSRLRKRKRKQKGQLRAPADSECGTHQCASARGLKKHFCLQRRVVCSLGFVSLHYFHVPYLNAYVTRLKRPFLHDQRRRTQRVTASD